MYKITVVVVVVVVVVAVVYLTEAEKLTKKKLKEKPGSGSRWEGYIENVFSALSERVNE